MARKVEDMNLRDLVVGGKNCKQIICERCKSKILPPKIGVYEGGMTKELNIMKKKTQDEDDLTKEILGQFFKVEDMFDFDNVGFSRSVDGKVKYLICADCEIGPIGFQDLDSKLCYVALARVAFQ